jgi:ubiquinone/menaquinone biosynthesis C-methylase UbiE
VTGDAAYHYSRLAARFEENWAYSPAFVAWMSGRIASRLSPRAGDRVIDVGCGTGLYSQVLVRRAGTAVCVDPSAAMLAQLPVGTACCRCAPRWRTSPPAL